MNNWNLGKHGKYLQGRFWNFIFNVFLNLLITEGISFYSHFKKDEDYLVKRDYIIKIVLYNSLKQFFNENKAQWKFEQNKFLKNF